MTVWRRPAEAADLDEITRFATEARLRRAAWAPVYFRPGANADLHPVFLEFMVGSEDHDTSVVVTDGQPVAFFVRIEQPQHVWIDDLCVADDSWWPAVLDLVVGAEAGPWVTCVAAGDRAQLDAMTAAGAARRSSYFARLLTDGSDESPPANQPPPLDDPAEAAVHTFGGRPFSPFTPEALVIDHGTDGHLVGSPSFAPPPLYDPGGNTSVVDRVVGSNRRALVQSAGSAAGGRGDAQLVVVCSAEDLELEHLLGELNFDRVVDVMGGGHG